MKKRIICLLLLCLFALSSTAFATNWVFVNYDLLGSSYIDTDSVVKNGDNMIFWQYVVFQQPLFDSKGNMYKYEAQLASQLCRVLVMYHVDIKNNKTEASLTPQLTEWQSYDPNSIFGEDVTMALKYAK